MDSIEKTIGVTGNDADIVNPRHTCAARVTVVVGSVTSGQIICGDLPEITAFKSFGPKHERKSQYANFLLSPLGTQRSTRGYPTIVNNIQPCPKLIPLSRVGARTDTTTCYG